MKKSNLLIVLLSALFVIAVFLTINHVEINDNTAPLFEKASIDNGQEKDDPWARIEYENRRLRNPATGKIPENIRQEELKFASALPRADHQRSLAKTNTLTWSARGPVNRGGRTRALGVDVRTNTPGSITLIGGGVSGGIWKSTDDGANWTNKLSPDSIHSATCIAQDTRSGHEDTWYVGTGEFTGNSANGGGSAFFRGDGIFRSTNNGDSWQLLTATSNGQIQSFNSYFRYVTNIAVNPSTGSVFAAASGTIQKSANGVDNWTVVRGTGTISSSPADVQISSTGKIYATIPSSLPNPGVWRSTDDGVSWADIKPAGFPTGYARNVIAINPNSENTVYFWVYTGAGASQTQLWRYTYLSGDGSGAGGNWENLTSMLPTGIGGSVGNLNIQGSYDMVMKVQPGNSNFIIIGGTNLYRTTDGFATQIGSSGWIGGYATVNNVSQYANHHPDQHSFVFLPGTPAIAYSGHDGGISRTNNIAADPVVWSSLNKGYVTSQFYSVAIDPATANDNHILGGLQDNGNWWTSSSNFNTDWVEMALGGDGAFTEISNGHTYYYWETQYGNVWRFQLDANGTYTSFAKVQPNYSTSFMFINPFVLDPNDSNVMYVAAGDTVFRNSDLTGIPSGNQNTTGTNWSFLINSSTGSSVSAIGVSKTPANRIYVGGSGGKILRFDNATNVSDVPVDVSTGKGLPSGGYVSCIAVDPNNGDNALVVFSNYSIPSLYYTSNGGTSWTDVSGNLEADPSGSGNGPSCRWASILKVGGSNTFYVATSTGLYSTSTLNGQLTNWAQEGATAFGNVVCNMVKTRESDGLVIVATHGAGIYSANQTVVGIESETSSVPTSFALNQNYPNPFNPSTKIKFNLPSSNNVKLTIYDITGRKVKELVNRELAAGVHTVDFDASTLASGTYIYRIQAGSFVQSKKMILLK